jgi:hypothetical protein
VPTSAGLGNHTQLRLRFSSICQASQAIPPRIRKSTDRPANLSTVYCPFKFEQPTRRVPLCISNSFVGFADHASLRPESAFADQKCQLTYAAGSQTSKHERQSVCLAMPISNSNEPRSSLAVWRCVGNIEPAPSKSDRL